ncbi:hypothetical protein XENORESO_012503, partial [Xenotaenia resolanae]
TPEQCPSVVSLLSESYNPHVRCGAAMALGICCAGTGNKEAINLLEPMTNDPVNYVRQGALIASGLIMIQQTEVTCPKVNQFRQLYAKVINDKHDDVMAKFGAILAQGILDAGQSPNRAAAGLPSSLTEWEIKRVGASCGLTPRREQKALHCLIARYTRQTALNALWFLCAFYAQHKAPLLVLTTRALGLWNRSG